MLGADTSKESTSIVKVARGLRAKFVAASPNVLESAIFIMPSCISASGAAAARCFAFLANKRPASSGSIAPVWNK